MAVKLLFAQIYVACVIMLGVFFPPRFATSSQHRAAFTLHPMVLGCRCTSNSLYLVVNEFI